MGGITYELLQALSESAVGRLNQLDGGRDGHSVATKHLHVATLVALRAQMDMCLWLESADCHWRRPDATSMVLSWNKESPGGGWYHSGENMKD
jgi:hypothetical protein